MATFVVCSRCSKTLEIAAIDQLPTKWARLGSGAILCPRCMEANDDGVLTNVFDEEVIYPQPGHDTHDKNCDECEVCRGPCQGH